MANILQTTKSKTEKIPIRQTDLQDDGDEIQNSENLINDFDKTEVKHKIIKNPVSSLKRKQNAKRKLLPCDKYKKGECQNGVLCSYMHQEFPCIFFYMGIKCPNEHCKFLHNGPLPINILKAFIKYVQTMPLEKLVRNALKVNNTGIENIINNIQIELLRKKYEGIEYETIASAKDSKPLDETLSFLSQQQLKQLKEMGIKNHYEVIMLSTWQLNTLGIKDGILYQKMIDACLDVKQYNDNDHIQQQKSINSNIDFDKSPMVINNSPIEISLDDHVTLARLPKDVFRRKILERNYYLTNHPLPKVVRIREMEKFCAQLKALQTELLTMMPVQHNSPKMSKTTMVVVHDLPVYKEGNELAHYLQNNEEENLNKISFFGSKPKVISSQSTKENPKTFKIRMPFEKFKRRNKCKKNFFKEFDTNRSDQTVKNENSNPIKNTLNLKSEESIGVDIKNDTLSRVGRDKFRFAVKKCRVMLKRLKEIKSVDVAKNPTPKKTKKLLNFLHSSKKCKIFNDDKKDGSTSRFEQKPENLCKDPTLIQDDEDKPEENVRLEINIQQTAKASTINESNQIKDEKGAVVILNKLKNQKETKFLSNLENKKKNKLIGVTTSIKGKVRITPQKRKINKFSEEKNQKEDRNFLNIDSNIEEVLKKQKDSEKNEAGSCIEHAKDVEVNKRHLKDVSETLLSSSSEEKGEENFSRKNYTVSTKLEKCFVILERHPVNSVQQVQKEQNKSETCSHHSIKQIKYDAFKNEKYQSGPLSHDIPKETNHNQFSTKPCDFKLEKLESIKKNYMKKGNLSSVQKDEPQIVVNLKNNTNQLNKQLLKETVNEEKDDSGSMCKETLEEKVSTKMSLEKPNSIVKKSKPDKKINKKFKKIAQKSKVKDTKNCKKLVQVSRKALNFEQVSDKTLRLSKSKLNIKKHGNVKEELKIVPKIPESTKLQLYRSKIPKLTRSSLDITEYSQTNIKKSEVVESKENKKESKQEFISEILKSYDPKQNFEKIKSVHSSTEYQAFKKIEHPNKNSMIVQPAKAETINSKSLNHIPVTSKEDQYINNCNINFLQTQCINNSTKTNVEKFYEDIEKNESNGVNIIEKHSNYTISELCGRPYKIPKMTILIGPQKVVASEKFQSSGLDQAAISSLFRNPFTSVERNDCNDSKMKSNILNDFEPSLKSNPVCQVQNKMEKNTTFNDKQTTFRSLHQKINWENVHNSTPVQTFQNINKNNATKQTQGPSEVNNDDDFIELSYSDISSIQSMEDNDINSPNKAKSKCSNRQHSSGFSSGSNIELSQELLQDWDQEFMSMNNKPSPAKKPHIDIIKPDITHSEQESLCRVSNFSSNQKVYPYANKNFGGFNSTYSYKDNCIIYLPWMLRKIDLPCLEVNKPDRLEELLSKKAYGDPRLLKYEYMAIPPIKKPFHQNPNEKNRVLLLNTLRNSEWYNDLQGNDKHQVTKLLLFTLMRLLNAYHEKCHQTTNDFDFNLATIKNANEIKSLLAKIHLDVNERGEIVSLDTIPKSHNTYNPFREGHTNRGFKQQPILYPRPLNAPVGSYFWPDRHSVANAGHQFVRKNKYYHSQRQGYGEGRNLWHRWY